MQFNSHALHTDYDVVKQYFDQIPTDLIYKLYSFFEADYIAFGYDPPWDWLKIKPPSSLPEGPKSYVDFTAYTWEKARSGLPRRMPERQLPKKSVRSRLHARNVTEIKT